MGDSHISIKVAGCHNCPFAFWAEWQGVGGDTCNVADGYPGMGADVTEFVLLHTMPERCPFAIGFDYFIEG